MIRMDADDRFSTCYSSKMLLDAIKDQQKDVIYPDNFFGSEKIIQKGSECHHVGGAIFSTRELNYVRFTDGLRGYEGLDLFLRSRDILNIGYLHSPTFWYSQRDGSMSKSNMEEREKIKEKIFENAKP